MTLELWYELETEILGHPPDMRNCPVPQLLHANTIAYQLFLYVRSQIIVTGMGDIIGMDMNAVISLLKLYEDELEEHTTTTFEKVWTLCSIYINHLKELNSKENANK